MTKEHESKTRSTDGTNAPETRWTQVAQRRYEPDGTEELTATIVFAIADALGVDPTDVKSPPVYECVDAAALEETFFGQNRSNGDGTRGSGIVTFHYRDFRVTVDHDGWVQVYEPTGANPS